MWHSLITIAGTFPEGLRFSSKGLGPLPPSVQELLSSGDYVALQELVGTAASSAVAAAAGHPRQKHRNKWVPPGSGAWRQQQQQGVGGRRSRHPNGNLNGHLSGHGHTKGRGSGGGCSGVRGRWMEGAGWADGWDGLGLDGMDEALEVMMTR